MKNLLTLALLVLVVIVILLTPSPLPPRVGQIDFRPFWSASYLFVHGSDLTDPTELFQVERDLTGWRENYPMLVWNPPWLFLLLTPFTFVSFPRAVWWWLMTNLTLIAISTIVVWNDASQHEEMPRRISIGLLAVFSFSMTLVAMIAGQVNTLVLAGLSAFLFLSKTARDELAGASLVLTTVKPQLVYVTLPMLLLQLIYARRWRVLTGFAGGLLAAIMISFAIRWTWVGDYVRALGRGPLLDWQMPTVGGVMAAFGLGWMKWIGVIVLPLMLLVWFHWRSKWDWRTLIDVSLLVGIPTTLYVWSYDQIVLLIPLLRIMVWLIEGAFDKWNAAIIVSIWVASDALSFYERILSPSEIYYFWVPLVIASLYVYAWRHRQRQITYA